MLPEERPIIAAMDDTIIRKTGTKINGVSYRRDPLSPPFHVNLVRGQRFIQISAALPPDKEDAPPRMIPIDFAHAPTAVKPRKNAPKEAFDEYKEVKKELNLSKQGVERIRKLRDALDADETEKKRQLWILVDGSYTNGNVLKLKPENTTIIGRIRADAKLYFPYAEEESKKKGRKRKYGERAPTPEELKKDDSVKWQTVKVYAAGKTHLMRIKILRPVLWRTVGYERPLLLIVIEPLAYRPRKGSRLLYRKPAHLISTNPDISPEEAVKAYVWRWDIEVNIRDEKQLIGVGQAQVRTESSVELSPALSVVAYSMLLLAAAKAFGTNGRPDTLPEPKWRTKKVKKRASTSDLIRQLRNEIWGATLEKNNFSGFATQPTPDTKPEKYEPCLHSAVLYALN